MRLVILLVVLFSFSSAQAGDASVKIGGCKKKRDGTYSVCLV